MSTTFPSLSDRVLAWFQIYGRKDLPWQQNPTPYRVWVSEIMLQQTQVTTVIPYYQRFMESFPDVITLANAHDDQVLKHWQGLGYYTRARNLHKAAQIIRDQYQGQFPTTLEAVQALPGIGRSTAGAILSLSLGQKHPILDGNVKRVLARYHALDGWTGTPANQKKLWEYAELHVPEQHNAEYTQAMMDMGATLCTRSKPLCLTCPLHQDCAALKTGRPQDYPAPKPAKELPHKTLWIAVVCNAQGEVLLHKRPPTGIWGGLWSWPEFDTQAALKEWAHTVGAQDSLAKMPDFKHSFSHYHLTMHAVVLELQTEPARIMEATHSVWYNKAQDFQGGLSSAAQFVLKQLDKELP
ncbi:A/G-specific adenine glycosylase [Thiofilum flexile]|uniref:A/G-specific adenine glycosylase n=1 Tax=Thiofilum flexile TaxID=125627 RepID=UPI0003808DC0|nr:A/G-specific adenine glycosylase [Thiofilum flexile]